MYEDTEIAGIIVHEDTEDEVASGGDFPPGPYVALDRDDIQPCV